MGSSRILRVAWGMLPATARLRIRRLVRRDLARPQDLEGATVEDAAPAEHARACRRLLTDLLHFHCPRGVDEAHGGYFESLEGRGFAVAADKHVIFQARQLWFFSALAARGIEPEATRPAADRGFRFLTHRAWDEKHGGFHAAVTRQGEPRDRRKHAYVQAFALYALAAYRQATGSAAALERAVELFETLQRRAHDPRYGGFREWFEPDWTPAVRSDPPRLVGRAGRKTFNTHLHLLEACAELYRAWPEPRLRERLAELVAIVTSKVVVGPFHNGVDAFHEDWSVDDEKSNLCASYGHDLEAVWLVLDSGLDPEPHRAWAEAVCRACLSRGYDRKRGGLFHRGALGRPADDRRKVWWVQAEALVALLRMYGLTGSREYFEAFARTFRFVQRQQVCPAGGWWSLLEEDGSRGGDAQRSGPWQAAYHAGRALLYCAEMLDEDPR